MLSRHGREGAHRVLIVLSQARWSGNDGGENCRKRARVGRRGHEPQGHMRTRHQKEGVAQDGAHRAVGPLGLQPARDVSYTCRPGQAPCALTRHWARWTVDRRARWCRHLFDVACGAPQLAARRKRGARRKFRNRQPGSARARLMNSFLPKFRYRRSRSRPNAPVGAVPAACELRACNSLLIYIPGKQPALGYCKQVK